MELLSACQIGAATTHNPIAIGKAVIAKK